MSASRSRRAAFKSLKTQLTTESRRRLIYAELLEPRWMLAGETNPAESLGELFSSAGLVGPPVSSSQQGQISSSKPIFHLDFEGVQNAVYRGPITLSNLSVPSFEAPAKFGSSESEIISRIEAVLAQSFRGTGVVIATNTPHISSDFSTIFIGGDGAEFAALGDYMGLSEQIDVGNVDPEDNAFVFSDKVASRNGSEDDFVRELANIIVHEIGHLMGYRHITEHDGDSGHDDHQGVLDEVGFKPYTHVEIAKDARADLLDDNKLTIAGHDYTVHPKLAEAIKKYPSYYNAGTVGPDGFPDLLYGQAYIHPTDTGVWLQRLFDMAWAAQTDTSFSPEEQLQILAFSYGYATHAAGDHFAHTLVNEFTEGIFPDAADIVQDDRALANAVRHFLVEGYIGDATPGFDSNASRTLLPDGDISSDATPGIDYDVPVRFVHDALISAFPGDPVAPADTGRTNLVANVAANQFRRVDGSFIDDGFKIGDEIHAFGFAANNGTYHVVSVAARAIQVVETIVAGDNVSSGDEALVVRGSRGRALDQFFELRKTVAAQADIAIKQFTTTYGTAPRTKFDTVLDGFIAAGPTVNPRQSAELYAAYLTSWRDQIDAGISDWAEVGLASTKGLFDAQSKRDVQNFLASRVGVDIDGKRADVEAGVGMVDVTLALLDDPNLDGDLSDGFTSRHLLPMFGVPGKIVDLQNRITGFGTSVEDAIVGPLRLALNPITQSIAELKEIPRQFVKDLIRDRWGIDVDQLEVLSSLANKLDLKSITIGSKTISVFKPGDHAKLDSYLGIVGKPSGAPLQPALQNIPGLEFYDDATLGLGDNVEFDKTKFAAYADTVTLAKLVLLTESPVDGATTGAKQLSKFVNDSFADLGIKPATPYDWSRLNVNGAHGGNVLTTTLQKPGVTVAVPQLDGSIKQELSDSRPWLVTIDGDHVWRQDSRIVSQLLYRVSPPAPTTVLTAKAAWSINVTPGVPYSVQASWQANVTQKVGTRELTPATNATYQIYDDNSITPLASVIVNQRNFANDLDDNGIGFDRLANVTSTTGKLRIELTNVADGVVISGPVRTQAVNNPNDVRRVDVRRNPNNLTVLPGAYTEPLAGWADLVYPTGTGNQPLWESELLRPVFRKTFVDWQNGTLNFPNLGDATSKDPNQFASGIVPSGHINSLVTPFSGTAISSALTGIDIIAVGNQSLNFSGTVVIASAAGNGDVVEDNLMITAKSVTTGRKSFGVNALARQFTRTTGSFLADGFKVGEVVDASGFLLNNGEYHITRVTATTLTVAEFPVPLEPAGDGDEQLITPGRIIVNRSVGGGRLKNFTLVADQIIVSAGVGISTRQVAKSGDPTTSNSIADSGNITFTAPRITVGNNATLLASATGAFLAGDVSMVASQSETLAWSTTIKNAIFMGTQSDALIDIGPGVVIGARDIHLSTRATTIKSAIDTFGQKNANAGLNVPVIESDLVEVNRPAAAVVAKATAHLGIEQGARLTATRDVTLSAAATADAKVTTRSRYFGLTYGDSEPTAEVQLGVGVSIVAAGLVSGSATAGTLLDVRTVVPSTGDVANVSVSYGKSRTKSLVEVPAGAAITAASAKFTTANTNSVSNIAVGDGFTTVDQQAGVGVAVALGSYQSSALTDVGGQISVTGNLQVTSNSTNSRDVTRALGKVATKPSTTDPLLGQVRDFLKTVDLANVIDGRTIDPAVAGADVGVGAAVALVESENKAAVLIGDDAQILVRGNLTVDAVALEPFQISATGNVTNASTVGVGGAVAWSRVANQATSFIGNRATVDVAKVLNINSKATITNPVSVFKEAFALNITDNAVGSARVNDQYADANAVGDAVGAALRPLTTFLTPFLSDVNLSGTSFVQSGGTVSGGAVAIGGGVNYLDVYNHAASGIAAGAKINQLKNLVVPSSIHDVIIDSDATVNVTNMAGLGGAALNIAGGTVGVGGYFNGLFLDNYAQSRVDDRTIVNARDVSIHSHTTNNVLQVTQAGTAANNVGVQGAFGLVMMGHESLAFIEDRAQVTASRDVKLLAENGGNVTNLAGGIVAGKDVGFGVAAAFTVETETRALDEGGRFDEELDGVSKTHAFIGDSQAAVGPLGTGGVKGFVTAKQDVRIDARSTQQVWTASKSGSSTAGKIENLSDELERFHGLDFGFGFSGDVSFNSLHYSVQAFARDTAKVDAVREVHLEATDTPLVSASAGSVVFGNQFGLGGAFAHNGIEQLTRAYTQDTTLPSLTQDVAILATNTGRALTFSRGGTGAKSSIAVAGSVNENNIDTLAEAALGARTVTAFVDDLTITGNADLTVVSNAGASSATGVGFLAVGAALDIGSISNGAHAIIGDAASVFSPKDLRVNANSIEYVLSVSASKADGGTGSQNRLYLNNRTGNPFAGAAGKNVGGLDTLTSSLALGDIDKDGDDDLVTGNFAQFSRRYINDGTGNFDSGNQIGGLLAPFSNSDSELITESSLIPQLTLAIALADFDLDGDLDVVTGNFGQANRIYFNDGKGNFSAGVAIGEQDIEVTLSQNQTSNNVTIDDLVSDLQVSIDAALVAAKLNAGNVVAMLLPDGTIGLRAKDRELVAKDAESLIASVRRDGLVVPPPNSSLVLKFKFDGVDVTLTIDPNASETLDNRTANDLLDQVNALLKPALTGAGRSEVDVVAKFDDKGKIVFAVRVHKIIGGDAAADEIIAGRRSFTLTYDDVELAITLAAVPDNDPVARRTQLQQAVDAALIAKQKRAGEIVVNMVVGTNRPEFALKSIVLDASDAEQQLAKARRAGLIATDAGADLKFSFKLSDSDATMSLVIADVDGNGTSDIIVGNFDSRPRVYLNLGPRTAEPFEVNGGTRKFSLGKDITTDVAYTTSIAADDLDRDGKVDIVVGNVGFDLPRLIEQGLVHVADFIGDKVIEVTELLQQGLTTLVDLAAKELINRFNFDPQATITVTDLINKGIASLGDLVRAGVLALEDFVDKPFTPNAIISTGLVTSAQLAAKNLVNAAGKVSLRDLVNSGLVNLGQLIGKNLVLPGSLIKRDVKFGDLLGSQITGINDLIDKGALKLNHLLSTKIELGKLIRSGIVDLTDLARKELIDLTDIDPASIDLQRLASQFAFGAPTRVYYGLGQGRFAPGVDLSSDRFVTRSLAIGDIDGDGDKDVLVGNSGTGTRLYNNLNTLPGTRGFAAGKTVSEIGPLVQSIALADMDGDSDLDLVVGSFATPLTPGKTRFYRNTGGNFGAGIDVSTDSLTTVAIVAGDVNKDGHVDVLVGNAKPAIGAAGAGNVFNVGGDVLAAIDPNANVQTNRSLFVKATDEPKVTVLTRSSATSGFAGVAAAVAVPSISSNVVARVNGDVEVAQGDAKTTAQGLFINANSTEKLLGYTAGQSTADEASLVASGVVFRVNPNIDASVGPGAHVTALNRAAAVDLNVDVIATHQTHGLGVAGGLAGATYLGTGIAAGVGQLGGSVKAHVDGGRIDALNNVTIDANSYQDVDYTVVGAAAAFGLAAVGSGSATILERETSAYVDGGSILASGNVIIKADSNGVFDPFVGAAAAGLASGIGASASAFIDLDQTSAKIKNAAFVTALAKRSAATVISGETTDGVRQTESIRGVILRATSAADVNPIAVAGTIAAGFSLAGAVNFVYTENKTVASIESGAVVNNSRLSVILGANALQSVSLVALNGINVRGLTGATGPAIVVGVSGAASGGIIAHQAEASIDSSAKVDSLSDIRVLAFSEESVKPLTATLGLAAGVAIAGAADAYRIQSRNEAFIRNKAVVNAQGSVIVNADNQSHVDLQTGVPTLGRGVAAGASVGLAIFSKTTRAFIDDAAEVTALGLKPAALSRDGNFTVSYRADAAHIPGLVGSLVLDVLGLIFDNPIRRFIESTFDIKQGDLSFVDVTPVSAPSSDPDLSRARSAKSTRVGVTGIAVSATSHEESKTTTIGFGAADLLAVQASAGAAVSSNLTQAFVGTNAKLNQPPAGVDPVASISQSVSVTSGSDTFFQGLAGGAAYNPSAFAIGAVGGAFNVGLLQNSTLASIGTDAHVRAKGDVKVQANAAEDVLVFSAAVAAGKGNNLFSADGAVNLISLKDKTHGFIGDKAIIDANGNVLVSSNDRTDVDLISGAATLGRNLIGAGLSATLVVVSKDTQAFVGKDAVINAKGNSAAELTVPDGSVKPNFGTKKIHGLSVQANSTEDLFGVSGAGTTSSVLAASGGVTTSIVDSDTSAFIDERAKVNLNVNVIPAGANMLQSVSVTAANQTKTFGLPVNLTGGAITFGLATDLTIIDNDTTARLNKGADVSARQDIDVHALSRIEGDSFIANIGQPSLVGGNISGSLFSLRGDVKSPLTVPVIGTSIIPSFILDLAGKEPIQKLLDGITKSLLTIGGGGLQDALVGYQGSLPGIDQNAADIASATPSDIVTKAVNGGIERLGTNVIVSGAKLNAGRDIWVTASERSDFATDASSATDLLFAVAKPNPTLFALYSDQAISSTRNIAVAAVREDSVLIATGNIVVEGTVENDNTLTASSATSSINNLVGAEVNKSKLFAGNDAIVNAYEDVFTTSWSILPRFDGLQLKDGTNKVANTVQSIVVGGAEIVARNSAVTAVDDTKAVAVANAITIGQQGPIKGVVPAAGIARGTNEIKNTTRAAVEASKIAVTNAFGVHATSNPIVAAIGLGVAQASQWAVIAASQSNNVISNTVDAHVSLASTITAAENASVLAQSGGTIVAVAGNAAIANGRFAVGASIAKNSLTSNITASVDGVGTTVAARNIDVSASDNADIDVITVGGTQAQNFTLGGSVSINEIGGTLTSRISNRAALTSSGAVSVSVLDDTTINAIAGQGSVSTGTGAAVGAALTTNKITRAATARIDDAATKVDAKTLDVRASGDANIVSIAAGGTVSQNATLGGAIVNNEISGTLEAHAFAAILVASERLTIAAVDMSSIVAIAGQAAVNTGGGFAVGTALANNKASRKTTASIAGFAGTARAPRIEVTADTETKIKSVAAVGAASGQVAADFSAVVNDIRNTTDAHVSELATLDGGAVFLRGSDDANIIAISGAGAGTTGAFALGAATGKNLIANNVLSYVDGATISGSSLEVIATTNDDKRDGIADPQSQPSEFDITFDTDIYAIVVGGAGASTVGLSGSLAINNIDNKVNARIGALAKVTTTDFVNVRAFDDSGILVVSGAGAGAGTVAGGAAISTNDSHSQVSATINGATVDTGNVAVTTQTTGNIKSVSIVGAGAGTVAGAAATSLNEIGNRSEATITNLANVKARSSVGVFANDATNILAVTGAGAGAGTVALSASISTNNITNFVIAAIEGAAKVVADSVNVKATEDGHLVSYGVGGSGAGTVSLTGSVGVNNVAMTIDAHVAGKANVKTRGKLTVNADNDTISSTFTGAAGGAYVGIGGAASYSEIDNHVRAFIDDATIQSTAGDVVVLATDVSQLKSGTVGLSGGFVGIAGNVGVISVGTDVDAYIARSNINAFGNVLVNAESDNRWTVFAGTATGGFVGVGGTVVVNTIENRTRAFLENATVAARGLGAAMTVKRWNKDSGVESTEQVQGLAVVANSNSRPGSGVGNKLGNVFAINGSGGFVGVGGVTVVNNIRSQTDAFISGSTVNSEADYGQSVIVRAHAAQDLSMFTGSFAGGFVGIGASIDRTNIETKTRAFISNTDESGTDITPATSVIHALRVNVETVTKEKIKSNVVGFVVGGVAISGAVFVGDLKSTNDSFVRDSDVFVLGNLAVQADDIASLNVTLGSLGVGGLG